MAASIESARLRPIARADLVRPGPPIGDDWQFEAEFARLNAIDA